MSKTLIWMQTGGCGGDSMALLCAERPSLEDLLGQYQIEVLWHPSLTAQRSFAQVLAAQRQNPQLDILCVEGSLLLGPMGTGAFDAWHGIPKIQLVQELADQARYVVAVGTCSAHGGVQAASENPTDCTGLQFFRAESGGLLGSEWRSRAGLPVINLPGCPTHPNTISKVLALLAQDTPLELDHLNRPTLLYSTLVHQGCTRNEYHEYDIEEVNLGGRGCMFFNLGCQGPMTSASCNTELWNGISSKTRAGVPCVGCTSPHFPQERPFFVTEKIGHIPKMLPLGVARAKYMAYKNLAKAAAPERVVARDMEI